MVIYSQSLMWPLSKTHRARDTASVPTMTLWTSQLCSDHTQRIHAFQTLIVDDRSWQHCTGYHQIESV